MRALVGAPEPGDDLELLGEALEPLAGVGEREAVGRVLAVVPPRAEADLDAPAAHGVDLRDGDRERPRGPERDRRDEGAEPDGAGVTRQAGEGRPGVGRAGQARPPKKRCSGRSGRRRRSRAPRRDWRARAGRRSSRLPGVPRRSEAHGPVLSHAAPLRSSWRCSSGTGSSAATNWFGDRFLRVVNRLIARASVLPEQPFYDPADFAWVAPIEANWKAIRAELDDVLSHRDALPNFQDISTDQYHLTDDDRLEDVLLLRLRVPQRRELRALPGDHPSRGVDPGDDHRDVLDPRRRASASRPTTARTRACSATTSG